MREFMLIVHFVGLAMGLGTSMAFMFLGKASMKLPDDEGAKFRLNMLALGRMGQIGLTLLVISGLYLIMPYHKMIMSSELLIAKLVLVLVLGALIGIISSTAKKAQKGDPAVHMKKIAKLGPMAMFTTLTIVVLAVLIFH